MLFAGRILAVWHRNDTSTSNRCRPDVVSRPVPAGMASLESDLRKSVIAKENFNPCMYLLCLVFLHLHLISCSFLDEVFYISFLDEHTDSCITTHKPEHTVHMHKCNQCINHKTYYTCTYMPELPGQRHTHTHIPVCTLRWECGYSTCTHSPARNVISRKVAAGSGS